MSTPYIRLNALDKRYKPLILKWLCDIFGYKDYPHSYADQWINWSIWDDEITVGFDLRQEEQVKLLSLIHPRFLGTPQHETLKIVNENHFYLELKPIVHIDYPEVKNSELLRKIKHKDNDGDIFYEYVWEVFLQDNTSIIYTNQVSKMDLMKKENLIIYRKIINERAFTKFLEKYETI